MEARRCEISDVVGFSGRRRPREAGPGSQCRLSLILAAAH